MKKVLAMMLCLSMIVFAFAGCSGDGGSSSSSEPSNSSQVSESKVEESSASQSEEASTSDTGEKTHITAYWTDVMNPPEGRILEYVNDKFGVDLEFTILPIGEWANHVNLGMASGNLADVIQIRNDIALTGNLIAAGYLYDMTDDLQNYSTLNEYVNSPEAKPYAVWDDKYYAVPREWVNDCEVMYYRKDLLDKYNLEVPTTLDEYYEAMKTIVENEPDMIGISESLSGMGFTFLKQFNGWGYGNMWDLVDGQYVAIEVLDSTKEGLKYMNKLYEAGIMDPEFMLNADYETIVGSLASGRAASVRAQCNSGYYYDRIFGQTTENIPGAEVIAENVPSGEYEYRPTNDPCADVWMCINSKCQAPEKVLAMWDWMWSPEGKDFLSYGIEGVHFTKDENGEIQLNEEEIAKETEDMLTDPLNKFQWFSDICSDVFYPTAIDADRQLELFEYNKEIAVTPLVQGFTSDNYVKFVGDMNTVRDEYFTKFITGELDIDENWQAFLDAFNQAGNDVVTEDVNAFMSEK